MPYINNRFVNLSDLKTLATRHHVQCCPPRQGGPKGTDRPHILGPYGIIYGNIPWFCMRLYLCIESGLTPDDRRGRLREALDMGMKRSKFDAEVLYWNYEDILPTLTGFELIGVRERRPPIIPAADNRPMLGGQKTFALNRAVIPLSSQAATDEKTIVEGTQNSWAHFASRS